MRLSVFIAKNKESILQAWANFARTIEPPALTMDDAELRDHVSLMLDTIMTDLDTPQTPRQQAAKSKGQAPDDGRETYAEIHATARLSAGYTIGQLVSEYRALRASVLNLWARQPKDELDTDPYDVTRFNEAIDQALAESVSRYSEITVARADHERRRLDAILEAAPVGIGMADKSGKMVLLNFENRRIWGDHPRAETVAELDAWKGWWADGSQKHGQPLSANEWALARALNGGESARDIVEIEPFGTPGERRTILLHAEPIRDAIENVIGSVMAQMDITVQVRMEAALRESEAKFKTIANAMPQMVWSTLPSGFHDYFNQQWYDFTGMSEGATDGETDWSTMFHPDDREQAWKNWAHSLATGDVYDIQYRLRHHSGGYRWTLGRALPIRGENGQIIRWMGTCTDIHDQKLAEELLKQESLRKDEFLAMLATAAQIMKMVSGDEKRVRAAADIISRQVKHMTNLVDDLLDVSRITRGLVELESEILDLKPVITGAIEQARSLIEARGHVLRLMLSAAPAFVKGDRTRLVQVVANLLNNAAKYTPQGGKIDLALDVEDGSAHVRVSDNGSGISGALLPHVFDLFTQGERTPDRVQGGLGLGLSLVKNITALHGGKASASSEGPGKGSQFLICLPLAPADAWPVEPQAAFDATAAAVEPLRLVLVDDNLDAAQSLAGLLEAVGHEVCVAEDGASALAMPAAARAQAFILDIGLPGMDGFELARRLRASPATAGAVLIALTGYGQAHDRVLTKAAGFDHHFVKPIDTAALAKVLAGVGNVERRKLDRRTD
jgi:PAS domain S-box-containing protein